MYSLSVVNSDVDRSLAPVQASSDEQLIGLWLHGRSGHTGRAYRRELAGFRAATGKPLSDVTLADLQDYSDKLATSLAPASQARALAAVKSLFTFAHKLGYVRFDVARVLKLPKRPDALAERILTERQTFRLIGEAEEGDTHQKQRNRVITLLLYAAGLRVSELCGLRWKDIQERGDGGQVTVFGKGGKTRAVLLPASVWAELVSLRGQIIDAELPVFVSRKHGGPLRPNQVRLIVAGEARRAKIHGHVSPHWLRHSHATHALENGSPIHLVSATLGHASVATTGRYLHARPTESSSKFLKL